ncbi:MAG: 4Fe-4S dicluster domain-containing protein [Spirochaetota bacterium]
MKLPKIRELSEAVKSLLTRPYTSKFPYKPHTPYPSFRGKPKFDQDKCVGCLACEEVCPVDAIAHQDNTDQEVPMRVMVHYTDTCIFCGCCEQACIANNEGIKLSHDWELSFFDRKNEGVETIEKELQLCEVCGEPVACKDHLRWIAEKIGELTYSSPTLYLSKLDNLGVIDPNVAAAAKEYGRSDRIKILCARHRRESTLTTEE